MRPYLRDGRERLNDTRRQLGQRHAAGASGTEICHALADLYDEIIGRLFQIALDELGETGPAGLSAQVALAPHGGYGRREVAPYSDADLMILHEPGSDNRVAPLAQRLLRDLFDVGLVVGQSARTPAQAWHLARQDPLIWSSLSEARWLAGSEPLFAHFAARFAQKSRRRAGPLIAAAEKARREERARYGETVYLLEPNIKRSRGGLRDIQLLRWIGFARYGVADADELCRSGALAEDDCQAIGDAREFLLRLRNEMHFHAGKANDLLDRAEQLRLAERQCYQGGDGLLPVEQFMRAYFQRTEAVSQVVRRFVASTKRGPRWGELLAPLLGHQIERDFRVGPTQISAHPRGLARVQGDLTRILRLAVLSSTYDKPIAPATYEAVRAAVPNLPDDITAETADRFRSLLQQPARLGESLRRLHEMRVLEKLVPAFAHARCLLQFNEYHKYTVDEHCLRAVEHATDWQHDDGPLGHVYRHIKRKWLLHLALLLHDLGKGHSRDHSEVGLEIARDTAERLHLSQADADTLAFLVHKHLMMSHLAFRRDTTDEQVVVRFAIEVGSPEVMQMLFVLTAADLAAVGPGVLNAWKIDVLGDLHQRAMRHLAGDAPAITSQEYIEELRGRVRVLSQADEADWFERQLAALPVSYLRSTAAERVADELRGLRELKPGDVMAIGRYQAALDATEYKIGTYESIAPGVFHKLTGALAGRGLEILSAEIHTLADGLVFDRFYVHDPDFAGEPPPARIDEVTSALVASLTGEGSGPTFRRLWRAGESRRQALPRQLPTQVRVDNHTSDRFTILDIFAADRQGLLYAIARTLFEAGLSVGVAKISTHLDQVVDVFYVTDREGRKVVDEGWLDDIRRRLVAEIEREGGGS